jgi:acetone carboxylase gamma subunit
MITVALSATDWGNVVRFLTEIRDSDRFAIYLDNIIDTIDAALDEQGRKILDPCEGCGAEEGEECRWDCLSWVT